MKKLLMHRAGLVNFGLMVIRVGIGVLFVISGYSKILGGTQKWLWLGSQMHNLGITFGYLFWGFAAACSEFFGGLLLAFGLLTRIAAFFIGFTMFVALTFHLNKGDTFTTYSHPLSLLFVCIGLLIAGGGIYSLDRLLRKR